ncbi:MAG: hypothetical protein WAT09_01545, partial [Paracoccaceae bacterium]
MPAADPPFIIIRHNYCQIGHVMRETGTSLQLLIIVTPHFNLLATTGLIDPMRAANYLDGTAHFRWKFASLDGGDTIASNGLTI